MNTTGQSGEVAAQRRRVLREELLGIEEPRRGHHEEEDDDDERHGRGEVRAQLAPRRWLPPYPLRPPRRHHFPPPLPAPP